MVKENGMVMMTEAELERMERQHNHLIEDYEKRLKLLDNAIMGLWSNGGTTEDMRVSKRDFLAIYRKALDTMFDNMEKPNGDELHNDIYGYDFTIHWHGIYCNCSDGAVASNCVIPAIESVLDEDDTEY